MDTDTIRSTGIQHAPPDPATSGRVTVLEPRWAAAAGRAFAASHAEYPAFRSVFSDPARRAVALQRFFAVTVRDAARLGTAVAVLDGVTVLGAAVWLAPGAFPWSARRQLVAAPGLAGVAAAYPQRFLTLVRYGTAAQRAHPAGRHWYLEALGVRPQAQRRGLGTRLLEPTLERADHEKLACYLETSDRDNIAFYERFGFEVVDDNLPLIPGGPTHAAMRREPR